MKPSERHHFSLQQPAHALKEAARSLRSPVAFVGLRGS
jgi:hypothetical protein